MTCKICDRNCLDYRQIQINFVVVFFIESFEFLLIFSNSLVSIIFNLVDIQILLKINNWDLT